MCVNLQHTPLHQPSTRLMLGHIHCHLPMVFHCHWLLAIFLFLFCHTAMTFPFCCLSLHSLNGTVASLVISLGFWLSLFAACICFCVFIFVRVITFLFLILFNCFFAFSVLWHRAATKFSFVTFLLSSCSFLHAGVLVCSPAHHTFVTLFGFGHFHFVVLFLQECPLPLHCFLSSASVLSCMS